MSSLLDVPEALALAIFLAVAPVPTGADVDEDLPSVVRLPAWVVAKFSGRIQPVPVQLQYNASSWLKALRDARHLPEFGGISTRIFKTSSGLLYVPVKGERETIDALRWNFSTAFKVAGIQARNNRRLLTFKLPRPATSVDVYIAHKFGVQTAIDLIRLARDHPRANAAAKFPTLAFQNLELFFTGRGARRSGDIYRIIERSFDRAVRRATKIAAMDYAQLDVLRGTSRPSRSKTSKHQQRTAGLAKRRGRSHRPLALAQ